MSGGDIILIYLDNCAFNRPMDNQAQVRVRLETEAKLFIQAGIKDGHYDLAWSYMLDFEISANPYKDKRNAIMIWRDIATVHCPSSDTISELGAGFMVFGIKPKDALHIACALTNRCEYFITTDYALISKGKNISGIQIVNPINFVCEVEK
jgi:hypothetical protein